MPFDTGSRKLSLYVLRICLFNVIVQVNFRTELPFVSDKPGFCPQDASGRPCADICSSDDSCPGNEKCCRYDCGLSCQVPTKVEHK
ncbi:hypothetical protein DPMN_158355 [Dreissena polymorpha]|uniref:WAP domain-containing protein n=1 Tax=Dreissena polymorpha TaxID=45954 RepID=A0A9D4EJN4_DREPO|nr:hypothetical protein DPMN_158355 [Dreissena polymorpha]